jgi:hypothetical protein
MNKIFTDNITKMQFWLGVAVGAAIVSTLAFFTILLYIMYGGQAVLKLGA